MLYDKGSGSSYHAMIPSFQFSLESLKCFVGILFAKMQYLLLPLKGKDKTCLQDRMLLTYNAYNIHSSYAYFALSSIIN